MIASEKKKRMPINTRIFRDSMRVVTQEEWMVRRMDLVVAEYKREHKDNSRRETCKSNIIQDLLVSP